MMQFTDLFPDEQIVVILSRQLSWSHFLILTQRQMELYLKWLDKDERKEGEETPIGLILCAESSKEQAELLEMHKNSIIVAEYWTELPSRKELEKKIHQALIETKERFERRKLL